MKFLIDERTSIRRKIWVNIQLPQEFESKHFLINYYLNDQC